MREVSKESGPVPSGPIEGHRNASGRAGRPRRFGTEPVSQVDGVPIPISED